jgi:serine/threonine protein kinase
MAPEIVLNLDKFEQLLESKNLTTKFYDKKVDIWSYGICLYELIFNLLPYTNVFDISDLKNLFGVKLNTQEKLYKTIDNANIIDEKIKILLKNLLSISPDNRIDAIELYSSVLKLNESSFKREHIEVDGIIEDTLSHKSHILLRKDIITEPIDEPLNTNTTTNTINLSNSWVINDNIGDNIGDNIDDNLEIIDKISELKEDETNNLSNINFVDSWNKINRSSSMIMKMSIDNKFLKWMFSKK